MILDQISLLFTGGALFLGAYFVLRLRHHSPGVGPDRELALLILACALNAAHPALMVLIGIPERSGDHFFEPLEFLLPPLLWIYAQAAVRGRFSWRLTHLLHFLPFVLAVAMSVFYTFGSPATPILMIGFWAFLSVQMVAYLGPALRMFHQYHNNLADRVSNWAPADLSWLRWFFWVAVGLCLVVVTVLILLLHGLAPPVLGLGLTVALTLAVWVLGSRGVDQRTVPPLDPPEPTRSVLPPAEANRIAGQLVHLFQTEKPHLDPDLDLDTLARRVTVPRNHLSFVINSELGQNFYELVNGWRLREFQTLAADPARRDDKLLTLAFDAGFNSKPTFNKVVLKLTGKTPSQLRQEAQGSRL